MKEKRKTYLNIFLEANGFKKIENDNSLAHFCGDIRYQNKKYGSPIVFSPKTGKVFWNEFLGEKELSLLQWVRKAWLMDSNTQNAQEERVRVNHREWSECDPTKVQWIAKSTNGICQAFDCDPKPVTYSNGTFWKCVCENNDFGCESEVPSLSAKFINKEEKLYIGTGVKVPYQLL